MGDKGPASEGRNGGCHALCCPGCVMEEVKAGSFHKHLQNPEIASYLAGPSSFVGRCMLVAVSTVKLARKECLSERTRAFHMQPCKLIRQTSKSGTLSGPDIMCQVWKAISRVQPLCVPLSLASNLCIVLNAQGSHSITFASEGIM